MTCSELNEIFLVTGSPRSGTTFVSDWITESVGAYCCHEILPQLADKSPAEIWRHMVRCSRTQEDRLAKKRQLEFMSWTRRTEGKLITRIGLKEPVTWKRATPSAVLSDLLLYFQARCVLLVRHPYDVVISGRRRALSTSNWPAFTTEDLCEFWLRSLDLETWCKDNEIPVLRIRWESLIRWPDRWRAALEEFLGIGLPTFDGWERSPKELAALRKYTFEQAGVLDPGRAGELSNLERAQIDAIVGVSARNLGYLLGEART